MIEGRFVVNTIVKTNRMARHSMQVFDRLSGNYQEAVQQSIEFAGLEYDFFVKAKVRVIAQLARKRLEVSGDLALLDFGCGVGTLHGYLTDRFARVYGVDVSKQSIAVAQERN